MLLSGLIYNTHSDFVWFWWNLLNKWTRKILKSPKCMGWNEITCIKSHWIIEWITWLIFFFFFLNNSKDLSLPLLKSSYCLLFFSFFAIVYWNVLLNVVDYRISQNVAFFFFFLRIAKVQFSIKTYHQKKFICFKMGIFRPLSLLGSRWPPSKTFPHILMLFTLIQLYKLSLPAL